MENRQLGKPKVQVSTIGLGTWVMGGYMWGGAENKESLAAIRRSIELGITLFDTAPIYGHTLAERLLGQAIAESGQRERLFLATKTGLCWNEDRTKVWRDSSRTNILREIDESLVRLGTEYIDLYQVHWPDSTTPFEETMSTLLQLQEQGKIRYIGVSNFTVEQMEQCQKTAPLDTLQPPYNLFEREIEAQVLPYCREHRIGVLAYSPLCRGLLTGKYSGTERFSTGDVRALDPKFQPENIHRYLSCVRNLTTIAKRYGKTMTQLAIRWCLDQPGVTVALCGTRTVAQIEETVLASDWTISSADLSAIDAILSQDIPYPVGPEFMAPA